MSNNCSKPSVARIVATASYLPSRVLTNFDLEKIVDTSDEWISSRTGMKERRIAAPEESSATMGARAGRLAIEKSGITPEMIDMVIVATMTPDFITPSTAALIQKDLQLHNAGAFDISGACTGHIYGLSLAKALIESNQCKNILLVSTEKMSAFVDYEDRTTCILFGDGAAANIISNQGSGLAITACRLGADGEQEDLIKIPAGGSREPASLDTVTNRRHFLKMQGNEVFKHAVRRMEAAVRNCLEVSNLPEEAISWLVPHQANLRIIDAISRRFGIPQEKVYMTLHKYGNTSASSLAIALDELLEEKSLNHGENILLVAFGAGLTWGSCLLSQI